MSSTPRLSGRSMFDHAPELGDAFSRLYGQLWRKGIVDVRTKELIRLRNARVTDCGF